MTGSTKQPSQQTLEMQFHRAALSFIDFIETTEYLRELRNDHSYIAYRAILTAAVVSYVRPFSNNGYHPKASEMATLPRSLTTDERALHEKLLTLRNTVVAHTDFKALPAKRTGGDQNGWGVSTKEFDIRKAGIDLPTFHALTQKQIEHTFDVQTKSNKLLPPIINA